MPSVDTSDAKSSIRRFWEDRPCGAKGVEHEEGTVAFYEAVERRRDELEPFIARFADFGGARGERVLEVGVGIGTDFVKFARAGADVTGIDLTSHAVELVRRRLALERLGGEVLVADAERLPFDDGTFDRVYSWGVLHHTPNTARGVAEAIRVLRPGGKLCLMLYARHSWVSYGLWVRHGLLRGRPHRTLGEVMASHLESPGTQAFTAAEIRAMLSGVDQVRIDRAVTPYDRRVAGPIANVTGRWLGFFTVVRARRAVAINPVQLARGGAGDAERSGRGQRERPRVLIHGSALRNRPNGARTLLTSLARELPRSWREAQILFSHYEGVTLPSDANVTTVSLGKPLPGWLRRLHDHFELRRLIERTGADVVIVPHEFIAPRLPVPVIVLAQNLIYHCPRIPLGGIELVPARLRYRAIRAAYRRQMPRAYARADAVVAVSRHAADRLAADADLDLGRTVVIPEGADALPLLARSDSGESRDLVMVGAVAPYKRIEPAIAALAELLADDRSAGYELLLVGGTWPGYARVLDRIARRLGVSDRVRRIGSLPPDALAELYARAHVCLALSACESFGLPLLEAMRAGVPAIVADEPWTAEMAGDAAIRVDATNPTEIADAVRRLEDPGERRVRSVAGREVARCFSWAKTASSVADLASNLITHRLHYRRPPEPDHDNEGLPRLRRPARGALGRLPRDRSR